MTKNRLLILSGGVFVALVVAGVVGVSIVSAQTPTPQTGTSSVAPEGGQLLGGPRHGILGWLGGGSWTTYDKVAEALKLTPEKLFSELHSGKTLEEIAEAQGVDIDTVNDAANASQTEVMREEIAQAVTDGRITQEQADWMLQGLEKGFMPMGRGLGHGRGGGMPGDGRGGCPCAPTQATQQGESDQTQ